MLLWQELRDVYAAAGVPNAQWVTEVASRQEAGYGFVLDVTSADPNTGALTTTHLELLAPVEWPSSGDPGTPIYDAMVKTNAPTPSNPGIQVDAEGYIVDRGGH